MTVYVATEEWNNCESYEDATDNSEVIGIFSSMEKAKAAVDEIIADRINIVKKMNPNITITSFYDENTGMRPGLYHAVRFDYRSVDEFQGPFHTYTFGLDYFEYYVQELEMDSPKTMYNLNGGVDVSKN